MVGRGNDVIVRDVVVFVVVVVGSDVVVVCVVLVGVVVTVVVVVEGCVVVVVGASKLYTCFLRQNSTLCQDYTSRYLFVCYMINEILVYRKLSYLC